MHLFYRWSSTSSRSNPSKQEDDKKNTKVVTSEEETTPEKPSFRTMMRRYGSVFFGTYFAVYFSTIGCLFVSVQSGYMDAMYIISLITGSASPMDPGGVADPETIKEAKTTVNHLVEFLESYSMTKPVAPMVEENPWTGNLAIAWIATKFTEPIRFAATVAMTPAVARFFGHKPTPTAVEKGPIRVVDDDDKNKSKDGPA